DVGREKRCVTPAQRKALSVRDGAALIPGATSHRAGAKPTTLFIGWTAAGPASTTSSCSASPTTTNSTTPAGQLKCATVTPNSFHPNGTIHIKDHDVRFGQS